MPALDPSELHVWKSHADEKLTARWSGRLLPEWEIERSGRFRFKQDRLTFLSARMVLRLLLSGYTGVGPKDLRIGPDESGKLHLESEEGAPRIEFNHAHSGELILLAFALGRKVGVDVEWLREEMPYKEIAERVLSPGERQWVDSLAPDSRGEWLVRTWVRKEAYLKARGTGLSVPLEEIRAVGGREGPVSGRIVVDAGQDDRHWEVQDLELGHGCLGAVAAEGGYSCVNCWNWSQDACAGLKPAG